MHTTTDMARDVEAAAVAHTAELFGIKPGTVYNAMACARQGWAMTTYGEAIATAAFRAASAIVEATTCPACGHPRDAHAEHHADACADRLAV